MCETVLKMGPLPNRCADGALGWIPLCDTLQGYLAHKQTPPSETLQKVLLWPQGRGDVFLRARYPCTFRNFAGTDDTNLREDRNLTD